MSDYSDEDDIVEIKKAEFEADTNNIIRFISNLADDKCAFMRIVNHISCEDRYDKDGMKHLIAMFVVARIMCDKEHGNYIDIFKKMVEVEEKLRSNVSSYKDEQDIENLN